MSEPTYLTLEDLLHVAGRTLPEVQVRDIGGLASAAARPQTTVFGRDAYPSLEQKAAALTHSLARNHPLVDGNKRLALASLIAFVGVNGCELTYDNDEAYELIMSIARGDLDDVVAIASEVAEHLRPRTRQRSPQGR